MYIYITFFGYSFFQNLVNFHQRQEFKFKKFCWVEVVVWRQYSSAYINNRPQEKYIWYLVEAGVTAVLKFWFWNMVPLVLCCALFLWICNQNVWKKNRIDGENVKYCSYWKCLITKHRLHDSKIKSQ